MLTRFGVVLTVSTLGTGERTAPVRASLSAPPVPAAGSARLSLADLSAINQALGVLLERGFDPVLGRRELQRRATAAATSIPAVARALFADVPATDPDT